MKETPALAARPSSSTTGDSVRSEKFHASFRALQALCPRNIEDRASQPAHAGIFLRSQDWFSGFLGGISPRASAVPVHPPGPSPVVLLQDFLASGPENALGLLHEAIDRLAPGGKLVLLPGMPFSEEGRLHLLALLASLDLECLVAGTAPASDELWAVASTSRLPALESSNLDTTEKPAVLFRGMVYGGRGYSNESLGVLRGLAGQAAVELVPLGDPDDRKRILDPATRQSLLTLRQQRIPRPVDLLYQSCAPPDFDFSVPARTRVARTTFETDRLPDGWLELCLRMDEVWVTSTFNRDVFIAAGYPADRLRVLPTGVDTATFSPVVPPLTIPGARRFKFLSIFDWHSRKAPDLLVRAFLEEFRADEDVCLILKVYQYVDASHTAEERLSALIEGELGMKLEDGPPILLLNGFLPDHDLPRLYRAADAFVLPSRGEGLGLPYIEALACECPVIATRWSGQLDFLTDDNSELIDLDGIVPVDSNTDVELFAGHRWAAPSLRHLRQTMRRVFENPAEAGRKAARGRLDMVAHLDWNPVLHRWMNEFQRIFENRKR